MQTSFLKSKGISICVPIMPESAEVFKQSGLDIDKYVPADIIEVRVDYIKGDIVNETNEILTYLKELFPEKLFIVTYRTSVEGGCGEVSDANNEELYNKNYRELLLKLTKDVKSDFIDVEINRGIDTLNEVAKMAHEKNMAVIGSYHNFNKTPSAEEMIKILGNINDSEADVLKMAVMPKNHNDVATLMRVTGMAHRMFTKPVVTMSMGEFGVVTRIYGFLYGSVITFGTVHKASAPGQIPADKLYKYIEIAKNIKIALIGFMGSGKSAVSKELSGLLGMEVKDTDDEIVVKEGKTIPEIFKENGEEYFREVETEVTGSLLKSGKPLILSCGGGVIKKEINRELLKEYGICCLLNAKPETILSRVKDDTNRPLLQGKMNVPAISELMAERKELYDMTAEIVVDVDNKSTTEIALEILEKVPSLIG